MIEVITESDKIREQLNMTDAQLADWLNALHISFERDGSGHPWPSYEALLRVQKAADATTVY